MLQNVKQAYQILGISEYAAKEEVKKAYRILCKEFHPDRNADPNATQYYIEVQQAYELIMRTRQYHEKAAKAVPCAAHDVFYKNACMTADRMASAASNREYRSEGKNSSTSYTMFSGEKKILGGSPSYMKKYEEMQQKNEQKRRLEREAELQRKEKERRGREELAARIRRRKLPSEKEAERREKIAVQKEAERIAGMIEKLMKL